MQQASFALSRAHYRKGVGVHQVSKSQSRMASCHMFLSDCVMCWIIRPLMCLEYNLKHNLLNRIRDAEIFFFFSFAPKYEEVLK